MFYYGKSWWCKGHVILEADLKCVGWFYMGQPVGFSTRLTHDYLLHTESEVSDEVFNISCVCLSSYNKVHQNVYFIYKKKYISKYKI